jgi:hypothetical protein
MQGHVFGESTPGSKPPDFNLGWSPKGAATVKRAPQPAAAGSPNGAGGLSQRPFPGRPEIQPAAAPSPAPRP